MEDAVQLVGVLAEVGMFFLAFLSLLLTIIFKKK